LKHILKLYIGGKRMNQVVKDEPMDDEEEKGLPLGDCDTSRAEKKIFLMKVPNFLYDSWSKTENGTELGSVELKEQELNINLNGDYPSSFPKEYNVVYTAAGIPIQIFSEDQYGQLALEGKVVHQCDMKPSLNTEYRGLLRGRVEIAETKDRQLKTIEDNSIDSAKPVTKREPSYLKRKREDDKRMRLKKEDLQEKLFAIFERSTYFNLKILEEETKQPTQWLREVLSDICIYNKRGPHKSMFELKPEYRNRSANVELEKVNV